MDVRRVNELVAEMEDTARQLAMLQAVQLRQLAEYAALTGNHEYTSDELAMVLCMTMNTACKRLDLALDLTQRLPATLAAMDTGDLDLPRAQAIADATRRITPELARAIEDELLPEAIGLNPAQVRRAAAKAVQRADPAGAEKRHQDRRLDRRVEIFPGPEGMADLYAHLPAEDATRIKVRLDAYAKAQPKTDHRTMDQRRTDIFTDLLLTKSAGTINAIVHVTAPTTMLTTAARAGLTPTRGLTRSSPAGKVGRATAAKADTPAISVGSATQATQATQATPVGSATRATRATRAALAGSDILATPAGSAAPAGGAGRVSRVRSGGTGQPRTSRTHSTTRAETTPTASDLGGVAELAGYGVITDSQVRALAAHDATWRRLLTDPHSGMLTDYGRHTYVPPAALADFVRARDQYCVFPGCNVPATKCDLDHRVPFPTGATSVDNLAAICRHHHRMKHRAGWTVRRRADGAHVWISPQEREYLNPPIPLAQPTPTPPPVRQALIDDTPPPF
jgi:hypothetical protein